MGSRWIDWPAGILATLRRGTVIPAHPLALDADRKLDARRQRALSRYYLDAGAAGSPSACTPPSFAIRDVGLYRPVLELAMRTASEWGKTNPVMIAGLAGRTAQAVCEAQLARDLGYHAGLLSLAAMKGASEDELIAHAQAIAREMPLVGFYLQPASRNCPSGFVLAPLRRHRKRGRHQRWRRSIATERLDVIRGVVEAGATTALPCIPAMTTTSFSIWSRPFTVRTNGASTTVRIKGGLLGHWSVWVKSAVELLDRVHAAIESGPIPPESARARFSRDRLQRGDLRRRQRLPRRDLAVVTKILRRQGLPRRLVVPRSERQLGPGQMQEIDRVCATYPELIDDAFVRQNIARWLA